MPKCEISSPSLKAHGTTRSTRCAVVSAIRFPPQELQKPRFLQEYGSSRSLPHCVQRRRKNPNSFMPHLRKDRNSSSTNPGTERSRSCCLARSVSNCSATTRQSRLSSGCRGVYSRDVTCTPLQEAYEKPNEPQTTKAFSEQLLRRLGGSGGVGSLEKSD